jgi:predicted O-linked N-acetylglucosamine transferase (SPINDLY family)
MMSIILSACRNASTSVTLTPKALFVQRMTLDQILNTAHGLVTAGDFARARAICEQILEQKPDVVPAINLLAMIHLRENRFPQATSESARALEIDPNFAPARATLGEALRLMNTPEQAVGHLEKALALQPDLPDAHRSLGICLVHFGKVDEAILHFQKVIDLTPQDAGGYNNLANTLMALKRFAEAESLYRRAMALNPKFVEAQTNLAVAVGEQLRVADAKREYRKAIAMQPNYFQAYLMLGGLQQATGCIKDALNTWQRARQVEPNTPTVYSLGLFSMNLTDEFTPEQIYEEHVRYADRFETPLLQARPPLAPALSPKTKLRIGYVSADFRTHPVRSFLDAALALDRERFDVVCFSATANPDDETEKLKRAVDGWVNIRMLSDDQAAERIRQENIDVLVDLSGHTGENRLPIFFRRPAPLQVTWLGYPNTTGLRSIDYRITDAHADPPGATEQLHSEKLWRLDDGFLCFAEPANSPDVAPPPVDRTGHITVGVFAVVSKITNAMINVWSQILKQAPESRIVLKSRMMQSADVQNRLLGEFEAAGTDPVRVSFLGRDSAHTNYLERFNDIDLMLDTYPYHGTTMVLEALWMGVPVVSRAGRTHVSRAAVSLLANVGRQESIAQTDEAYIAKAVELSRDLPRLREIRRSLRGALQSSPLMDQGGFARKLGDAFFAMWDAKLKKSDGR